MTQSFDLNLIGFVVYGIAAIESAIRGDMNWATAFLSGFIIFLINIVTNKMMKK